MKKKRYITYVIQFRGIIDRLDAPSVGAAVALFRRKHRTPHLGSDGDGGFEGYNVAPVTMIVGGRPMVLAETQNVPNRNKVSTAKRRLYPRLLAGLARRLGISLAPVPATAKAAA